MGVFRDSEEVYRYVGGVFRQAAADPELAARFRPTGVVLRVRMSDPDATILVDMPNAQVFEGDGEAGAEPSIELAMSADDGHRFWLGELNMAVALARGKVRTTGSTQMLLKLVPMARELHPRYRQMLADDGRTDLLAV